MWGAYIKSCAGFHLLKVASLNIQNGLGDKLVLVPVSVHFIFDLHSWRALRCNSERKRKIKNLMLRERGEHWRQMGRELNHHVATRNLCTGFIHSVHIVVQWATECSLWEACSMNLKQVNFYLFAHYLPHCSSIESLRAQRKEPGEERKKKRKEGE